MSPLLLGHRGDSANHAENTLAAFAAALACGADGVELDVRLSRDGVPVVIHDATLDRTTAATGPVASRTAAELQQLGVPTLRDALRLLRDTIAAVEVKPTHAGAPHLARDVVELAAGGQRLLVLAFDAAHLESLRDTGADTVLNVGERPADPRALLDACGARWLGVQWQAIDAALCAAVPVIAWTVDGEDDVRSLLAMGVRGVISNRPCALRALVPTCHPDEPNRESPAPPPRSPARGDARSSPGRGR